MLKYFLHLLDIKQSLSEPSDDVGIEMHFVREKKLVDKFIIKSGMLRFNFLLECSHPGTVPDPQLVAAMLQLVRYDRSIEYFFREITNFAKGGNSLCRMNYLVLFTAEEIRCVFDDI